MEASLSIDKDENLTKNNHNSTIDTYNTHTYYILGQLYERNERREQKKKEESIVWWSYRSGFAEMKPYGFKSDTGWGCMLRASQMLLTEVLKRHRSNLSLSTLLKLFADAPGKEHPYGIHGICRAGLGRDKFPGEWFGPREGCYVIKDVMEGNERDIEVEVVGEGCLFVDKVMGRMERVRTEEEIWSMREEVEGGEHDPLFNPPPGEEGGEEWEKALLILVPLRLGVRGIDGRYRRNIVSVFGMSSFVGMMGGTPRHAIYFHGVDEQGGELRGKDPHYTQAGVKVGRRGEVEGEGYRESVKGGDVRVRIESIDPSLALGFYLRDRNEFVEFVREVREGCGGEDLEGGKRLFSVEDRMPDYGGDLGLEGCVVEGEGEESEDEWEFI